MLDGGDIPTSAGTQVLETDFADTCSIVLAFEVYTDRKGVCVYTCILICIIIMFVYECVHVCVLCIYCRQ